jgi:hypothetical protein
MTLAKPIALRVRSLALAGALLFTAGAVPAATAQTSPPESVESSPTPALPAWRISMAQIPPPKNGCFTASYPATEWQEVQCTPAPPYPQPPRIGPPPETAGNGDDISPQVPTGFVSTAIGSSTASAA